MQMEGKKKKGKERERRRAQGVCQARRTCVVCVPGVAGLVVTAGSRRVGLRCVVFRCNQDIK